MLLITGIGAGCCVFCLLLIHSQAVLASDTVLLPVSDTYPAQQQVLTFPLQVSGTCLIAEQLVLYEGPFWEDGSGREVANTAALLLRNPSEHGVESTRVVLEAGGEKFVFEAAIIPPGQAVLIPEVSGRRFSSHPVTSCSGQAVCSQGDWTGSAFLDIRCVDLCTVEVTNLTDRTLTDIRLYYQNYIADPGFFVGGKPFMYTVEALEPGQKIQIIPNNYANGYSGFLQVALGENP